jgi:RimJ/RimL family protein N-acetyltransferase
MRFVEGKVIKTFHINGKKVVFRYPMRSDLKDAINHINSLVEEKACIAIQKKKTPAQEKKYLEETFQKIRKGEQIKVCVEVDGRYAGDSSIKSKYGDARKHVVILGIALDKNFRNIGIGTELMKTMEILAKKEMKASIIKLSYFEENERSRHVYEKLGYKEAGRIPKGINHYGKYMDEVLMVKVLK